MLRILIVAFYFCLSGCSQSENVSVTEEEIANYSLSTSDCYVRYANCSCSLSQQEREKHGAEYETFGQFAGKLADLYFQTDTGLKRFSKEELIVQFGWDDRSERELPGDVCVPTNLQTYAQVGPPTRAYIVERLTARKKLATKVAVVKTKLANIQAPENDGAYIVTNQFDLIPLPLSGELNSEKITIKFSELPNSVTGRYKKPRDAAELQCIQIDDANVIRIDRKSLIGVYTKGFKSFPFFAVNDEDLTSRHPTHNDYCKTNTGFGFSAERGDEKLTDLSMKVESGDIYALAGVRGGLSMDRVNVAVFIVE